MTTSHAFRRRAALLAAALSFLAGCSASESASAAPGDSRGGGADSARGARSAGGPGGGGAGGGAGSPTIVLSPTDVGVVQRKPLEAGIPITGDLKPIEEVQVRARLEGDLDGVFVREGDRVAAGQVLAHFEASQQESARRSAEAERAAAQSSVSTAQWNAEQSAELFKAGAIAEQALRNAQEQAAAARAQLAAAQSRVRAATSDLSDTHVRAPTAGVIDKRMVENGEHLARGAQLFSLVRTDVLELGASVPARNAAALRAGQTVHFVADGRQFDGRVARVSPTVDPVTRSVTVYVQVPNATGALRGNTFATGRVVGNIIPDALTVPSAAIRQSQDTTQLSFVYRLAGEALERAPVRTGVVDEAGGVTQILDGLAAGDRVVVGNVGVLGKGMKVQIVGGDTGRGEAAGAKQVAPLTRR
ncbi:MAG TPA: efflux RND transporter periplasmic adaptor subunit [Gemmatimonadaceae bacterium]|nr:efflux RND transporter periplasmic adaptor subunit [Gemmatimonadaceae bacterium]